MRAECAASGSAEVHFPITLWCVCALGFLLIGENCNLGLDGKFIDVKRATLFYVNLVIW